jgi:hypothetical protein
MLGKLIEQASDKIVDIEREHIICDYHEARGKGKEGEEACLYVVRRVLRRFLKPIFSFVG